MRGSRGRPLKTVPVSSLVEYVEARGGIMAVLADNEDLVKHRRRYSAVKQKNKRISWQFADEFCVEALGQHPAIVFGEDWWQLG